MRPHNKPIAPTPSDVERFLAKVDTSGDCWLWTGGRFQNGYGCFVMDGRLFLAHRVAYTIATCMDPGAQLVLHRCDNPPCCRPDHLFRGENITNSADMVAKGRATTGDDHWTRLYPERIKRSRTPRPVIHPENPSHLHPENLPHGDEHWTHQMPDRVACGTRKSQAKVTEQQVREMRARYVAGGISIYALSREYRIAPQTVHNIVRGLRWKHVT